MMTTKLNIELLKRLRTRFLRMRHPEHFRIEQVAVKTDCGASMCFIGHTLDLAGYKMRLKKVTKANNLDASRCDFSFITPAGGVVRNPFRRAQAELGLLYDDAYDLFQDWTVKTPKQAAARIQQLIDSATTTNRRRGRG